MKKAFPNHKVILLYDTETTGLNTLMAKMIQFGFILVDDGKISEKGEFLINWDIEIPAIITELTGITQEDIEFGGITPKEAYTRVSELLKKISLLGAHNASFDASVVNTFLMIFGDSLDNYDIDYIDSLSIVADIIKVDKKPRKPRKNSKGYDAKMIEWQVKADKCQTHQLMSVCRYYGIDLKNAHTALADIEGMYKILKAIGKNEKDLDLSYYINKWGYKKRWQIDPLQHYPSRVGLYSQGNNGERYILNAKEEKLFE